MIMNMDNESNVERFKAVKGIGLYKINYEMDITGDNDKPQYTVGIIAYTSEEAIKTLANFCKKNVKGFKGFKVQELAFEGLCHDMSDKVKNAILNGAINEGKAVANEAHQAVLAELDVVKEKASMTKKTIVPKKTTKKD